MEIDPVRAWAEYDEWLVYYERISTDEWSKLDVPKGLGSWQCWNPRSILGGMRGDDCGPLRSLRVLLSNGYELRLSIFEDRICQWALNNGGVDYTKRIANGMFTENTDSEAVDRVLADAVAWFGRESK